MLRYWLPVLLLAALPLEAQAVSEKVRRICKDDYLNHCASHEVGSDELRACMRKFGSKLSRDCVDALVEAGEVSRKEVEQRRSAGR